MTDQGGKFVAITEEAWDAIIGLTDDKGRNIGRSSLVVYGAIRRDMDYETKECWPKRSTIAERSGYKDKKSVDPYIKALEDLGVLSVREAWTPKDPKDLRRSLTWSEEFCVRTSHLYTFHDDPARWAVPDDGTNYQTPTSTRTRFYQTPTSTSTAHQGTSMSGDLNTTTGGWGSPADRGWGPGADHGWGSPADSNKNHLNKNHLNENQPGSNPLTNPLQHIIEQAEVPTERPTDDMENFEWIADAAQVIEETLGITSATESSEITDILATDTYTPHEAVEVAYQTMTEQRRDTKPTDGSGNTTPLEALAQRRYHDVRDPDKRRLIKAGYKPASDLSGWEYKGEEYAQRFQRPHAARTA